MSVSLDSTVSSLLTNRRRVGALKSLGVLTVRDALTYYPFRVTDPVPVRPVRQAAVGAPMAFAASVEAVRVVPMNARRGFRFEALVADDAGASARLVFFSYKKSYVDWLGMRLRSGARVVVSGVPSEFNGQLQFTHPEIVTVGQGGDADSDDQALRRVSRPRPVYHASSRISSEHIHETIMGFLTLLDGERGGLRAAIADVVPEDVRAHGDYPHRCDAFRQVHDPDSVEAFHRAIAMLRYEEALVSQTALIRSRHATHAVAAYPCGIGRLDRAGMVGRFIDALPFALTAGQRDVVDDILHDMAQDWPMQRLLQGEVGSGKTVVAVVAMLAAVAAGHQAVLVAPTQVLAEQHAENIGGMIEAMGESPESVPVVLLTGGMRLAARRRALAVAASGQPCIIVATHAAFSKTFQAPGLALVVIDEQHRFGVEQRESLRHRYKTAPHLLVMTATPIPRTAAMTWFGDLDVSWLTELPGGRKPIRTVVIPEADGGTMARMLQHIRARIDAGERAYVVCPRIDADDDPVANAATADTVATAAESGTSDEDGPRPDILTDDEIGEPRAPLHSVAEIAGRLAALPQFRGIRFATLTGRDDDETKTRVMASFASGETPVLVSTTVIEVGVDVRQASCIVIFDADRFGLSQLHQLRGRVGRGGTQSWAFLISRAEPDSIAAQRLEVIRGTLDGSEIAQADLELRGAGDVLGDAQSGGKSSLKLLRVVKDAKLIEQARADAEQILADDPRLAGDPQLAGAVLDFTRGNESFLMTT